MKIGLVDLDTSHPEAFLPLLRSRGHEVIGVWDSGSVHPAGYAQEFATKNHIPMVFESLQGMAGEVDCAMLHACDWDTHLEKARIFLDGCKSVFLDKPLAGNAVDLTVLSGWVARGRRIAGGSALLYCAEVAESKVLAGPERGDLLTVFCGCGVDEFNYGIHGYAMALAITGFDALSVRHLGMSGRQDIIEISHAGGSRTLLQIGKTEAWLPFHATLVSTRQVLHFTVNPQELYSAALDATLPFLEGKTDVPPLEADALIQPERCALAALISKHSDRRVVSLSETLQTAAAYDGAEFAAAYRAMKYPLT